MKGYDRDDAVRYMMGKIDKKAYVTLNAGIESLIRQAMDIDFTYMRKSGVLDEQGMMGDAFYDDDEAFEFILDAMLRQRGYGEEAEAKIASLVDDYMDLQNDYLTERGMVMWDDEMM